jgi:thiamine-monophosphate kinase
MTSSTSNIRLGEFELIHKLFAPLSRELPGAFELADDVAVLPVPEGHELVLKTDAVVEGVHFHTSDPPETIAKKALRVNISDFAAKGASPRVYLLALALPNSLDMAWLEDFARGLAEDQEEFGVILAGGDTVGTPGALTIAVMMSGFVPRGSVIRRNGAAPGDIVYVTGTLGDAGGGLELLKTESLKRTDWEAELIARFRVPHPRLAFGQGLRGLASASLDVSDGLIADLGHIADVSHVRIEIFAERIPVSQALRQLCGEGLPAVVRAATAGDDYEIAFTASPRHRVAIHETATRTNTCVAEIGRVAVGEGAVLLDAHGDEISLARRGYTHF